MKWQPLLFRELVKYFQTWEFFSCEYTIWIFCPQVSFHISYFTMIPRFPSKTQVFSFFPLQSITLLWNYQFHKSGFPLTLEGFRVSCLPFGDFLRHLFQVQNPVRFGGKIPPFPVVSSSHRQNAKHLGLACRPKAFCAATLRSSPVEEHPRWMDLVVSEISGENFNQWRLVVEIPIIYKGFL